VRNLVAAGAGPIDLDRQPLYLGLVIGDDRHQPAPQRARFRAAGLSHLLAVSGQNVAFVLAVARPGVMLLPRRGRLVVTWGLLVLFAMVTRFEPSVLRATTTAGLAAWAAVGGLPQSGVRLLGLAVAGLVLVDPFLVSSVGFQLSVAASGGIVVVGPLLIDRVRGPAAVIEPLAVTLAAQLGVLPLLLLYFGPVSMASVPANLLAGWASGLVMMLGLTVGVVAGLAPVGGAWLQAPSSALLWWLDAVASWGARLAAPVVTPAMSMVVVGLGGVAWLASGRARSSTGERAMGLVARVGVTGCVVALGLTLVASVPGPPVEVARFEGGGVWFPGGAGRPSVLVVTGDADDRLLEEVLAHRIGRIDLVISEAGQGEGAMTAAGVNQLATVGLLLGPPQHRIVGATRLQTELTVPTSSGELSVVSEPTELTVTIRP
jgi:competence protein ComEC